MPINKRNMPGSNILDPSAIDNLEYNNAAGSKKVSEVGRHLLPLGNGSGGYTTDASGGALVLKSKGKCLAVYNNSGSVQTITLGESSSISSLGVGVTDLNGHVGIPCTPNNWTYVACGEQNWVISSSSNLKIFLVDDNSYITQEASQ